MRTLSWLLAVVLVVAGGWWLYDHTTPRSVSGSGDVFSRESASSSAADTDIDGKPYKSDAVSSIPAPAPAPAATVTPPVTAASTPSATLTTPAAAASVQRASLPTSDTLERDAPAGMAFGGKGKYQWYRQGNITWRIDTASGNTCVDFATMDEWTKPIVYSNGCRFRG